MFLVQTSTKGISLQQTFRIILTANERKKQQSFVGTFLLPGVSPHVLLDAVEQTPPSEER